MLQLRAKLDPDHRVIDLVGRDTDLRLHPRYEGAGW